MIAAALKYLGYSANDTDEAHWKQARDLIIRAKPYWAAFNASSYHTAVIETGLHE